MLENAGSSLMRTSGINQSLRIYEFRPLGYDLPPSFRVNLSIRFYFPDAGATSLPFPMCCSPILRNCISTYFSSMALLNLLSSFSAVLYLLTFFSNTSLFPSYFLYLHLFSLLLVVWIFFLPFLTLRSWLLYLSSLWNFACFPTSNHCVKCHQNVQVYCHWYSEILQLKNFLWQLIKMVLRLIGKANDF